MAKPNKDELKGMAAKSLNLVPKEDIATAKLMDKIEILSRYDVLIKELLPRDSQSTPETIATLCAVVMSESPEVAACDIRSLLSCVIKTAVLDLNPMPMFNEVYFIPRKKKIGTDKNTGYAIYAPEMECNFQIGYEGWLKLMWDTGRIEKLSVEAVHMEDEFEDMRGSKTKITHKPCGKTAIKREDTRCVYCIVKLKGMDSDISIVLYRDRIEHLRKMGLSDYEKDKEKLSKAWEKSYIGMAQAKAIHQIAKLLPLSRSAKDVIKSRQMLENTQNVIDITPEAIHPAEIKAPEFDFSKMDLDNPKEAELAKFYALIEQNKIQPFTVPPEVITKLSIAIENGLVDIAPIPVILMNSFKIIEEAIYKIEQAQ